jgi:hypothetical protein
MHWLCRLAGPTHSLGAVVGLSDGPTGHAPAQGFAGAASGEASATQAALVIEMSKREM